MKTLLRTLVILPVFLALITGCDKKETAITGLSIDQTDISLTEGETCLLVATLSPAGADGIISWSSKDNSIATVDDTGTVTAMAEGTTTVTAAAGGYTAACTVTVAKKVIPVESITLSQESAELSIGETLQLTVNILPENASSPTLTWNSDNTDIVTVDETGLLTAISSGETAVTATVGDISATCMVTVKGASMSFTIDLSNFPDSKSYILPFINKETTDEDGTILSPVTGDYTLTINWGDNSEETLLEAGTDLTTAISHEYSDAVEYSITITSSAGYDKQQIPLFRPGYYHKDNSNTAKLKSMDTPLLNMSVLKYSNAFSQCSNLQSVCEDLYIHNTRITIASSMFNASGLTTVPENILTPLRTVENLSGMFVNCKQLSRIPAGLFRHNTEVTMLGQTFMGCSSLTEIPDGLFDNNTEVTTFLNCFSNCTALESVPEKLFANNKACTIFGSTFMGCTKLALNSNIFCDESTEKDTRFKELQINFNDTFRNCGSELEAGKGGTAPALWEYAADNPNHNRTFQGCTAVTNVGEIDPLWL